MAKKLFCELNPITYKISVFKGIFFRKLKWLMNRNIYAKEFKKRKLPIKVYEHKSLIRRKFEGVDMRLQENKAVNLALAVPKINGIIIKPKEVFSFWKLVGSCTKLKGYKDGLIIKAGKVDHGIGGGMCQFTNLIHWMILHSPLTIIEHHHHDNIDMFPDYERKVPFGTGTSIMYNYLDYQFINNTNQTFQLIIYTTDKYLCGELRTDKELDHFYHIVEENSYFTKEGDEYYRNNEIYRIEIDKKQENILVKPY
ncbi:VanW family protein [Defluviitalea phaphyphila]|uniref:VanW family protein n=1 Tax=Defluviitalea phaphyphila TaxID=1473580 RepID=UPI000AEEBF7D|nr:VanW family protein [Defluviitalea phaphyphila]